MSSFEEEYNKRLRRVGGIYDDTVEIRVESGEDDGYWSGGCETCNFYSEGEPWVKIFKITTEIKEDWRGRNYAAERKEEIASFSDLGELIRALDNVELDSVG